ncbi:MULTISPECIES: hypothetical protein [Burkholderia]|jgi:hypothetical protein|uniref:Lipoprotein n=2 Tax=Burkholderia contaminans TaxID=488447 RepID=A0A6P2L0N2_9BURK|nr:MULTISPECIES: hypothetical protein [Burkholderia]UTP23130.1 hypothetical protein NMB33_04885 [Burkholderia sp. FXe9]MBA9832488.1 hypothetical protein [Burkholderia contaminans]MBA9839866.1 hypothetical protein [Burkholderia contaminans]MBA9907620.1 hypothetical protein [Burkholderia contaminans]MBH9692808.1 hypothetical protein [Burkholderia contaminans]
MTYAFSAALVATISVAAFLLPGSARAQATSSTMQAASATGVDAGWIKGKWQVSVAGEATVRTLDVANLQAKDGLTYTLDATYGVTDTQLQPIAAELHRADGKWTIAITTQISAAISAESSDQKAFSGTITYKNGISKPLTIVMANTARHWLSHDEVAAMLIGKRVTFVRLRDGTEVTWQLDDSGMLYAHNSKGQSDNARWQLSPQGELCLTWKGNSGDGCLYAFRDGDNGSVMFAPQKNSVSQPWSKVVSP